MLNIAFLLVIVLGVLALLGPLIAAFILAVQLNNRRRASGGRL
jgi:hypothetical protein